MTGKEFLDTFISKKGSYFDLSVKKDALNSLNEFYFKKFNLDELFPEYKNHTKAPLVLYYLIKKDTFLKKQNMEAVSSYVSMLQLKSDNTDWSPDENDKIAFEIMGGSNKRVLDTGLLTPTLSPYKSCISYKKVVEFLKLHTGFYIDLDASLDKENLSKEVLEGIKKLNLI